MKFVRSTMLPLEAIAVIDRLRETSVEHVEILATSMGERGLQQPVEVWLKDGAPVLMAGAHRLEAARRLEWAEIRADVYEPETHRPEFEARLHEIDENLIRHELNPLDRAAFVAERKAVYEAMYPEAKRGAHGGRGGRKNETAIFSFSKTAARKTGLSPRLIERAVRIYANLTPDVRTAIRGTKLAGKEGELYRLAGLDRATQRAAAQAILGGKVGTVDAATRMLRGEAAPSADDVAFARLVGAWAKSPPTARKQFKAFIEEAR